MQKEIFCTVRGRVQMVMFRDYVCRKARRFKLLGHVKNRPDGTVEVLAQGEPEQLEKFIAQLQKGSLFSKVEKVEVKWRSPSGQFSNFRITL
jgi:acylphosphatase